MKSEIFDYCKLWHISWLLKSEKISTKLGVKLYGRAKIQTFTTGWLVCGKYLDFNPALKVNP